MKKKFALCIHPFSSFAKLNLKVNCPPPKVGKNNPCGNN